MSIVTNNNATALHSLQSVQYNCILSFLQLNDSGRDRCTFGINDLYGLVTYDLHLSDILLPPYVILVLWTESCYQIVGVHDDMNDGIDKASKNGVTASQPLSANP